MIAYLRMNLRIIVFGGAIIRARAGEGRKLHPRLPRSCTRSKIARNQQELLMAVSDVGAADEDGTDRSRSRGVRCCKILQRRL